MIKFALGVSVTLNLVLIGAGAAVLKGVHTPEGANIINLYFKSRGLLAERS